MPLVILATEACVISAHNQSLPIVFHVSPSEWAFPTGLSYVSDIATHLDDDLNFPLVSLFQ